MSESEPGLGVLEPGLGQGLLSEPGDRQQVTDDKQVTGDRQQAAFGRPIQQMTTLHDMSLTNNSLSDPAVSNACLLAAVGATSAE